MRKTVKRFESWTKDVKLWSVYMVLLIGSLELSAMYLRYFNVYNNEFAYIFFGPRLSKQPKGEKKNDTIIYEY